MSEGDTGEMLVDAGLKIVTPPESRWVVHLLRSRTNNWKYTQHVLEGMEPCWFHRKMQELCFGVKWKKLKD